MLKAMLGQAVQLVEKGVLDGLAKDEVDRLAPRAGDYVLVTWLRDGTSVKVARRLIVPKIQRCIEELEGLEVDLNVLLCTGEFPGLRAKKPLIMPEVLITSLVRCVRGGKIGVVVPEKEQISGAIRRWKRVGVSVVVASANPYSDTEALKKAALLFAEENVDLTVLDCIGFALEAKEIFRRLTGKPAILPQALWDAY